MVRPTPRLPARLAARWAGAGRRARLVTVAIVALLLVAVGGGVAVAASGGPAIRTYAQRIAVMDGPKGDQRVSLDTTLYVPEGVDAAHRAPAVIVSAGFGGTKDSVAGDAQDLAAHGYVVLAYSARGFGRSTGQIALDSPDYEVKDVRQLIDWLARRPEVRLDGPGDPRVGLVGGSYGGAISLLTAAYDHRVDAIVPMITWNDLAGALFPGGVFKKMWAGQLFAAGFGPGGTGSCGRFLPTLCQAYAAAATAGRPTPAILDLLRRSSPGSVLDAIRAPTLLVQGESDTLFGLDQADANARGIAATGTPVQVVWYAGGHDAGAGLAETDRLRALTVGWFDHYLAGTAPAPAAGFSYDRISPIARSDTGVPRVATFTAPGYPGIDGQPLARRRSVPLAGPPQPVANPPGGTPAAVSSLPGVGSLAGLGGALGELPGQSAAFTSAPLASAVSVVGGGTVTVRVSSSRSEAVLFAKLYDVEPSGRASLPQGLVTPLRVTGLRPGATVDVPVRLPYVVHKFDVGHRIRLVFSTTDQAYATPTEPATYQVSLMDSAVSLPLEPGTPAGGGGSALPYLLATAALLLLAGGLAVALAVRARRHRADPIPELAGVPLRVTGLRKVYAGGLVAVDDVAFAVGRGQVLGLLGPNGAGKTTTLRVLMGLVHATAGEIRVFGELVRPGAEVLRRLGSFVEGPGFLPHLSGLDNLTLYWQATGRPLADARLQDVLAIADLGEAVHRPVRTYSHGMKQRLAIAQAMLGFPQLLVLDEPTNGLDPPQIRAMREVVRSYASAGRTVLVSSHLLAEVEQTCSHAVVMARGRVVASGTVDEVTGSAQRLEDAFLSLVGEEQ